MDSSKKGSKLNLKHFKISAPNYVRITNRYASLPAFSAPPDPLSSPNPVADPTPIKHQSHYRLKIERRRKAKWTKQLELLYENEFFDISITRAEDERTVFAKANTRDPRRCAVNQSHQRCVSKPSLFRGGINAGYSISTTL